MSTLVPANVLYCYDATLEGFFSAVFSAYARHEYPQHICATGAVQPALGQEIFDVPTSSSQAERVRIGLTKKGGYELFRKVKYAFLSSDPQREDALFAYIVKAMQEGRRIHRDAACPCVAAVEGFVREVMGEREHMYQFARFEELEGGVFFARINPKANVVPIMMSHFVERFSVQPFIIYDETHHIAGVYDMQTTSFVSCDDLNLPECTSSEELCQQLWKTFYDSLSHEQRYNPDLRRSFMPKRFWKNITEIKTACA